MKRNSLELHKILLVLLAPEYVGEALKILLICTDKWCDSFIEEINKKSYNTACMAIDFAYNDLVERGVLIKSDDDKFGMDL